MNDTVKIHNISHVQFEKDKTSLPSMERDDICFYRFVGGNSSETEELIRNLDEVRDQKVLLLGIFRFPYRFEGKRRMQTAIKQYYWMKEICDSIIFFHGDGMLDVIDSNTILVEANQIFNSFEEQAVQALEDMICNPGEMNIDAHDIKTFIKESKGPLFLHVIEEDSFDEPLKYLISAPYLPENYTDGKQMIINIGYTKEVDMAAFKTINLRLNDMFHKADLVKLGTYFMNKPGNRLRITMLVNGIEDPYEAPNDFRSISTSSLKLRRTWEKVIRKGKGIKLFSSGNERNIGH